MQGLIISFDTATQEGLIRPEKGDDICFNLTGWRGRGLPDKGIEVSFEIRPDGKAGQVFNLPAGQLKAIGRRKAGSDEVTLPWYKKLGRIRQS